MSHRHARSIWLLALLLVLVLALAACGGKDEETPEAGPEAGTPAAGPVQATATPPAPAPGPVPINVRLETALSPAMDPICLEATDSLILRAAPLPAQGLEPGMSHLFCAVGAPDSAEVTFTFTGPAGEEHIYTATSVAQDGVTIAPLNLQVLADDAPGAWTLRADDGAASSELTINVNPASGPFIAMKEPFDPEHELFRASIGGLKPGDPARFVLYSLSAPSGGENGPIIFDGTDLISTGLLADASGRADLELDVADLPEGSYLLLLIPYGTDLGDPAVVHLPDQQQLVAITSIFRPLVAEEPGEMVEQPAAGGVEAGAESGETPLVPALDAVPAAPQPVETGGGLPEAVAVSAVAAPMPACEPGDSPSLQLWPSGGEIGDWWFGCLRGFAPNEAVQINVTLANGGTGQLTPTTGADGTAPFRWYGIPGEGVGPYGATAQSASGLQAQLDWEIGAITRPHVLVFPHEYKSGQAGTLNLSGFPANSGVEFGLYRLDENGGAALVKTWSLRTNKWGAYKKPFDQVTGVEPGQFLLVAQGGPAFQFDGIDVAASAIEFFSFNADLDSGYETYTLYAGRDEGSLIAAKPEAEAPAAEEPAEEPAAEQLPAEETPPAAEAEPEQPAAPDQQVPPQTVSLPEDVSDRPACPGATPGQPTMCLLPDTLPRGTFAYLLMHDFPPGTAFNVRVTPPKGPVVALVDQADSEGFADMHWYTLNTEPTGEYKVVAQGGGVTLRQSFTVVSPTSPHVIVQSRVNPRGFPVIVSVNGFEPGEKLILARYRRTGTENGMVNFELIDTTNITTGGIGGGQRQFGTSGATAGDFFLVSVHRPGQPEALAQAVYTIEEPLFLRYPFAWGQNFVEGQ